LCGLISDFNDDWSAGSPEFMQYEIPEKNRVLWLNALDPAQNTGIMAAEPVPPSEIGMILQDNGLMSQLISYANESYLYLTILLREHIDYEKERLIIGLDTYQRSNGEYLYDPNYFATSLSGLEYIIKFESNRSASLYVVPSYNRSKGAYSSKESDKGEFDYVCALEYGTFETSNTNFYFVGTNINIRIPWSMLNYTDPSSMIVLDDSRTPEEIAADPFGIRTQKSDGIIFSVTLSDIKTYDTLYQFPTDKHSPGYKTFKWTAWETVNYRFRVKESYGIIQRYFNTLATLERS